MKILIINTNDISGGGARASYRLHKALLKAGIDSQMLVQNKNGDDWRILFPNSKFDKLLNIFRPSIRTNSS